MCRWMRGIRDPILVAALVLALGLAAVVCSSSLSWIGRTFPGFLVLQNGVVASAGLAHWPAARSGRIYQHELVRVAGRPLEAAERLPALLEELPRGAPVEFALRRAGVESVWHDVPRPFTASDFLLLHGTLLFCGIGLVGIAGVIRFLRGSDRVANGTSLALWVVGLYALTAVDLYGPYRFFRLHAFLECLLFAATFHCALVFPQPARLLVRSPWAVPAVYGAGFLLAGLMQLGLFEPGPYVLMHRVALNAFALALAAFIGRQIHAFLRPPSFEARQRVKVVALGTVAALTPQVAIMLASATSGGRIPENLMSFSGMFFPISLSYAVLRQDLFGVDRILRRTLNYALLTGFVGLVYAGLIVGFDRFFPGGDEGLVKTISAAVLVVMLLPLRDRIQNSVDRLFFRSAYDFRRLVETTSDKLASVRSLPVIAEELERPLRESFEPEFLALDVRSGAGGSMQRVLATGAPAHLDTSWVGSLDKPVELEGGGLAVPFRVDGQLVALLTLGPRRSGRFYGGDDRRLLQTLANQGAVALQNAIALESLAELNRGLEGKVAERTAELARTLDELRGAQSQLVQQEKMAALGQLVAGVAHEINNPVNFIKGNVCFVEEHTEALLDAFGQLEHAALERLPELAPEVARIRNTCDLDHVIEDLPRAFDSCRDGLERTTTIIRDLRSFSRHDGTERRKIDLREAIESTLGLLHSRLTDIEVVRDFEALPEVECLGGQMGQVLINLLTNAADAIGEEGRIVVRTRRGPPDFVTIEVEDDGCGIAPDQLERIFDPFFSTKEVGKGTGLGLAITYGIVSRHGGRIEVRSEPGRGSCFHVELPIQMREPASGAGVRDSREDA